MEVQEPSNPVSPHEILKARRLEKGIALEKAREDTKIPQKYIVALEEGNYGIFPAKVYMRGFFLNYCKYLGVADKDALLRQLMEPRQPVPVQAAVPRPDARPKSRMVSVSQASEGEGLWGRFSLWMLEGSNKILVLFVLPAVLLGGFFAVHTYFKSRQYQSQPKEVLDVSGLLGHQKAQSSRGSAEPVSLEAKGAGAKLNLLIATKGEPSWMQVEADGAIVFQGILPAHQKRSFAASGTVKMRLGNPKSIDLKVNDAPWALTREELEKTPLEKVITADSVPPAPRTP